VVDTFFLILFLSLHHFGKRVSRHYGARVYRSTMHLSERGPAPFSDNTKLKDRSECSFAGQRKIPKFPEEKICEGYCLLVQKIARM